jgi:hypothetical protein
VSKRKITIAASVLILLIAGTVWALWSRTDPRVVKVQQMQLAMYKENKMPDRAQMEELHKAMRDLPAQQRHELMEQGRAYMERRMDERIDAFFALPKQERTAYLDKEIKQMEERRKQGEANRTSRGQSGQGGTAGGPGGSGGPQANAGGAQANGPGGPPPPNTNPEARLQRRNQRLDSSTAQQRAKRSAYFAALQQRRSELGLPPLTRPGPPPGARPGTPAPATR